MSNLQLRVISAIVLAVVTLGLTWLGGLPFRLLCAAMSILIFYEWTRMCRPVAATG
ncbi:MAG: phosphatidate cytidylyltransferase, partial [Mesorhizobium sp.]